MLFDCRRKRSAALAAETGPTGPGRTWGKGGATARKPARMWEALRLFGQVRAVWGISLCAIFM